MTHLHLAQAGFIKPVLNGLEDAVADLNPLLISSGLNKFHLGEAESYVPVHCV